MANVEGRCFGLMIRNTQQHKVMRMQSGDMWDWFPYVFFPFKILVLGIGMFYAIKWHHDQAKKK